VKRLVVACPSFVSDCLETLEEIGVRERERFMGLGGESLELAPCVNDSAGFSSAVANLILKETSHAGTPAAQ
jgi:ferrochelatase